ncbi:MAG TPA: hypothetical protein VL832_10250, partial [Puia sp.]|nr:hypothetical protein [Puia sp.]
PRLSINNLNNNYRSSDLWVKNGAYVSLKSLSLGYTLTKLHISDWQLPEARFYATGYNLFMITRYPGYTPELGYTSNSSPYASNPTNPGSGSSTTTSPGLQRGVDLAQYPPTRNFTIGVTINF